MRKIKTGIIGTGKVGHLHAAELASNQKSEFTSVLGRSPEKTNKFADQYGVKAYTDLDAFLKKSGVEALCICTPHPAHRDPSVAAAEAGVHLLVEKPLASSLEDCDAILDAVEKSGVKLGMLCQRRFYEPCARVHEAIEAGKIERPILGTVTVLGWRDQDYYDSDSWRGTWKEEGGGVLVNQAVHQLDLLLWYMGPVAEVSGYWGNLNHPSIEVDDTAVASIRFKSGALGQVIVSNSYNPAIHGKVSVLGSNGSLVGVQTDGGAMFIAGMSKIEEPPLNDYWTVPGEESKLPEWIKEDTAQFNRINAMEHYHALNIDDFLEAIIEDREPCVSGQAGRETVELFTAIYRSGRDGKSIQYPLYPEYDRSDLDGRLST
ncbi:Gfo/Idh/MocA family protein [Candidatus Pelagisphaera phototrophica]|uniref:Gfo/Idh/MocA family protein n=1 Tax=Candidatus Pelagisphaera phototrophica TaxID=2684113 RepID=UPI0019E9E3E3|nr:Gfo/Idh/MocA family oxidoreductase [Candidatus Pelagisphaera phototrophica]QXD31001.1 Gfo/Idh/MocA family oxidoreductase [Candidatus Pelagisphaera phototrophica]